MNACKTSSRAVGVAFLLIKESRNAPSRALKLLVICLNNNSNNLKNGLCPPPLICVKKTPHYLKCIICLDSHNLVRPLLVSALRYPPRSNTVINLTLPAGVTARNLGDHWDNSLVELALHKGLAPSMASRNFPSKTRPFCNVGGWASLSTKRKAIKKLIRQLSDFGHIAGSIMNHLY